MDDIYLTKLTNVAELSKLVKSLKETNDAHQKLNGELRKELAQAKEDHQFDNLVHEKELKELREKTKK